MMTPIIGASYSFTPCVAFFLENMLVHVVVTFLTFPTASCSAIHRVYISNLQKEIEKQSGYRSSRKRRSEFQYDYEVYHSLEEVAASPTALCPLLSNRMHTQSKPESSARSSPTQTVSIPELPNMQGCC